MEKRKASRAATPSTGRKKSSRVIRSVRYELKHGPKTLQKALLLKEVLDGPVALREQGIPDPLG